MKAWQWLKRYIPFLILNLILNKNWLNQVCWTLTYGACSKTVYNRSTNLKYPSNWIVMELYNCICTCKDLWVLWPLYNFLLCWELLRILDWQRIMIILPKMHSWLHLYHSLKYALQPQNLVPILLFVLLNIP